MEIMTIKGNIQVFVGDCVTMYNGAMKEIATIDEEGNSFTTTTDGDTTFSSLDVIEVTSTKKKDSAVDELKASLNGNRHEDKKKKVITLSALPTSNFPFTALSEFTNSIGTIEVTANTASEFGVKALKYLTDSLAGRNTVNNMNTIDSAILALLLMKEMILTGKDDRKIY